MNIFFKSGRNCYISEGCCHCCTFHCATVALLNFCYKGYTLRSLSGSCTNLLVVKVNNEQGVENIKPPTYICAADTSSNSEAKCSLL